MTFFSNSIKISIYQLELQTAITSALQSTLHVTPINFPIFVDFLYFSQICWLISNFTILRYFPVGKQ